MIVLLNSQLLKWLPKLSGQFLVLGLAQMNRKPNKFKHLPLFLEEGSYLP